MRKLLYVIPFCCLLPLFILSGCKKGNVGEKHAPEMKVDSVYSWLCNMQMDNGLLLSSEGGRYVSLYDNSLAAILFAAYGDYPKAEKIFDFFDARLNSEFLVAPGGFGQFRYSDGTPVDNKPHRWLGDNAWLLIALNSYHQLTGSLKYQALTTALSNWIISLQDADGGVWGGYDKSGDRIGKITEGNIDAFNAITGYTGFHKNMLSWLYNSRWDKINKVFITGANEGRYKYALDLNTWSYCAFTGFPESVLNFSDCFLTTCNSTLANQPVSGYCFDTDRDVVWLEGTGQMVVAFIQAKSETKAQKYLGEIEKNLTASSTFAGAYALPYTTNPATSFGSGALWGGADINPAVSSTVWYLLGKLRFDPLDLGYGKDIPDKDKFWKN